MIFFRILFFLSLVVCSVFSVGGSVISEAFERRDYDLVITHALESKEDFSQKEWLLIAEAYLRKGDTYHALEVYRRLIAQKELFPNHVRSIWPLLDDAEKTAFTHYYLTTFGYNQELFYNYYFFARAQYRDDDLARIMESVMDSVQQADMLDFLGSYYVAKGLAEEKLSDFGTNAIISAFIAIAANNSSAFIDVYRRQSLQWQRTLVQYCMRRKKRTILKELNDQKLLTDTSHKALFDVLELGHTAVERYTLDSNEKRRLLTDLAEFEAMHDVKALVQRWSTEDAFHDFRGKIALSEKNYTAAFQAYYDWYKATGAFDGAMFRELISFVSLKALTIKDDRFWSQFPGLLISTKDADKMYDIIPFFVNEKEKATILKMLVNVFPYHRNAPFIRSLSQKTRIEMFAEMMIENADTTILSDIGYIQNSELPKKNELLGDIYLFFKNDRKEALKYYSLLQNTREKTYKMLLVYYVYNDGDAFFDTIKTFSTYYKACMLMEGDMLVARGDVEDGYGKYTVFLEKTYSQWLKNDAQKRVYLYLTDKNMLKETVTTRDVSKHYILWR